MSCGECKAEVNDQKIILCDGFCHNYFHLDCINMDINTFEVIDSSHQIRWYCANCNGILEGLKEKSFIDQFQLPVINAINQLKDQFATFKSSYIDPKHKQGVRNAPSAVDKTPIQKGTILPSKNSVPKTSDKNLTTNEQNSIKARLRSNSTNAIGVNSTSSRPNSNKQSTPLSSTSRASHSGQKTGTPGNPNVSNRSILRPIDKLVVVPPRSWIFLSRLSPSTTTEDVHASVSDCLCTDDLKVIPLIRKSSQREPEYISFKIGIPWNLREKALDQSTWPSFLSVREFSNHANRKKNFLTQPRVTPNEG